FNNVLALAFGVLIVFLLRITVDQDPSQSQHGVNGASHSDAALDCWSMILFRKPGIFQDQALVLVGVQLALPFWGGESHMATIVWPTAAEISCQSLDGRSEPLENFRPENP
ncbi:MAG: hypothetical protein WCD62_17575, partial [Pseudolabrys sp.]